MMERLTCREMEILLLRVNGYTRTDIAEELRITVSTVKTHLESIHRKLEVSNQAGLVNKAFELGVVKANENLEISARWPMGILEEYC